MANERFRVLQNLYKLLIDMGDGTHAERVIAQPPAKLLTGDTNPRLRTDNGRTGFFEKREIKTFKEFETATTGTYIVKLSAATNFILLELDMRIIQGTAWIRTYAGGSLASGTLSDVLPNGITNTMSEGPDPYTPQSTITGGIGTITGGLHYDTTVLKTSTVSTFSGTAGAGGEDSSGRAPGDYFVEITMTDVIGVFRAKIEERP